MNPFLSEVSG